MKILQLCLRIPFPPADGGNIAMLCSAEGLLISRNEVHIAAVNTPKHHTSQEDATEGLRHFNSFISCDIETEVKLGPALLNLIGKGSYNIDRFYSLDFDQMLIQKLNEIDFDIVQFESIFMLPYLPTIRRNSKAKISLRAHNVEHIIWQQLAVNEKNFLKSKYLKFLAGRMKEYELHSLSEVDAIIAISPQDAAFFKTNFTKVPVLTSPVSLPSSTYLSSSEIVSDKIFHLGSMDWLPNVEAITWFLKSVWPEVIMQCPETKLHLAGRKMPEAITKFASDKIVIQGFVNDSKTYMKESGIMIVPLLSGSGIRVKIIEGLALGVPIVSTALGAEGIAVTSGKDILIANDASAFAEAIITLLKDPERSKKIAAAGQELFTKHYSLEAVGKELSDFYANLLS